jgi:putative ABC transport system ATP-binding protein
VKRVRDGRGRRTVIDGVTFDLARGELVVLRGPSGSGKTTLLALVGAMLSPTSGEVLLDGEPTSRLRDAHRAQARLLDGEPTSRLRDAHRAQTRRAKVGFVFQDLQLVDAMSARENVLLPKVPDGVTPKDEARADALLARFGVAGTSARARALSGGERQRVALARALLLDPPILLLDEPTAHLDDAHARAIAAELAGLAADRDHPRAVLVATHDARIAAHADVTRVLDLADGKLLPHAS